MPMRRLMEKRSPTEIAELKQSGGLEAERVLVLQTPEFGDVLCIARHTPEGVGIRADEEPAEVPAQAQGQPRVRRVAVRLRVRGRPRHRHNEGVERRDRANRRRRRGTGAKE